jgi:hypothetical protein
MTAPEDPAEMNDVLVPTEDGEQQPPPATPAYATPPPEGIPDAETE